MQRIGAEFAASTVTLSVILYSQSSLKAALPLYRKLGFQEVLLEHGLCSGFCCDIRMKKPLTAASTC